MASIAGTFTAAQQTSTDLTLGARESLNVILTRTGSGDFSVALEERVTGLTYQRVTSYAADTAGTVVNNDTDARRYFRLVCLAVVGNDSIAYTLADVAADSLAGYPVRSAAGDVVLDVTDAGIEAPTVTATTLAGTLSTAAQTSVTSLGVLTALQVDNLNINGNTISSTAGTDLNITPLAGQQIVLDGVINVDAGVVTGATSITSTDFLGNVTGAVAATTVSASGAVTLTEAAVVGAVAGSSTTASTRPGEYFTTITLTARALTVTDALAYAGTKVFDFPSGRIRVHSASGSLQFGITTALTTINGSAAMDWSLGTVTASNITLATTMLDLIPKVDAPLNAAQTTLNTATTGLLAASATFDGTVTPVDAFLNVAFPTNTEIDADGDLAITGVLYINWSNYGPV